MIKEPLLSLVFFVICLDLFVTINVFWTLPFAYNIESGTFSGIWTTAPSYALIAVGMVFAYRIHRYGLIPKNKMEET